MNIKPLGDKVVLERVEEEHMTPTGLIYSDRHPTISTFIIIAKGDLINWKLKLGDKVLMGSYMGMDVKIDGKPYVIAKEEELLAVIPTPEPTPIPMTEGEPIPFAYS